MTLKIKQYMCILQHLPQVHQGCHLNVRLQHSRFVFRNLLQVFEILVVVHLLKILIPPFQIPLQQAGDERYCKLEKKISTQNVCEIFMLKTYDKNLNSAVIRFWLRYLL